MQIDCQLEQTATTDSFYQTSSEFQIAPGKPFYYIKGKFVRDKQGFEYNSVQEKSNILQKFTCHIIADEIC